jgi:hypothetical protein
MIFKTNKKHEKKFYTATVFQTYNHSFLRKIDNCALAIVKSPLFCKMPQRLQPSLAY